MFSYNTLNWENFKYKNSANPNKAFEALSYYLFCYEFDKKYGIPRYFNQAGIETDPIIHNQEIIGFQSKYYDDTIRLSQKKEEIKSAIKITKQKYKGISKIVFYINKEFSQSRKPQESKPEYLKEIEEYAEGLFIKVEWRTRSYFEKMLMEEELNYQFNLFFNPESSEKYVDVSKIKKQKFEMQDNLRIKRKLNKIENENIFNEEEIEKILNNDNKIILLSDAGSGKTEECKYIVNKLNTYKYNFAFYTKLNIYCGESIEQLIPEEYNGVDKENIIFILDGFDEIAIDYRRKFIINLESFCNKNKDTKVILTSRSNFYDSKNNNQGGTIEGFNEYFIEKVNKENINSLLSESEIDIKSFWREIEKNELMHLVYNPFFLIKIIEIYAEENELPNKTIIFDYIINRSLEVDRNKFKNANDLENFEKNVNRLLGIIAVTMELLERNYLKDEEYRKIIENDKERKIIEYASIWKKQNNETWSFLHKNFGEYLAAQSIKKYSVNDIKEIITYNDKIKNSWLNVLVFLINFGREDILDYVIEKMPEFILYIENSKLDLEFKRKIFIKIFEKYEHKKIWIDYNIRNKFNLISDGKDIFYLIEKVKKNEHYTITTNALMLLQTAKDLFENKDRVRNTLLEVCQSNKYVNYSKAIAIKILAKFDLCDRKEFKNIIEQNKKNENSELRRSYYFFLKKQDLVSKYVYIILERYDYILRGLVANGLDDDTELYSFDEQYEFTECFKYLKTKNSIITVLKFFDEEKVRDSELNREIIINIFDSITKVYSGKDRISKFLKLYSICEQHYDYKIMRDIINKLKDKKMLLNFFKAYLKSNNKKRLREYEYIIDDECMEYFYNEYKKENYNDQIAEEILRFCSKKLLFYEKLKLEYEFKTGKKVYEYIPRKKIDFDKVKKTSKKIFIDKMFDKNQFIMYVGDFLKSLNKKEVTIKELHELYDVYESNEKYYELYCFICAQFNRNKKININTFKNWDWNWFIFVHAYVMLSDKESDLELNETQKAKINELSNNYLKLANFKNAIEYTKYDNSNRSWTTNQLCVCLWYYKYRYGFEYPSNILLDMLEFEYYINGKKVGIDYIVQELEPGLVKKRIVKNIHEQNIHMDVFENHIEYCIKNDIKECEKDVAKYFCNKKLPYDERDDAYRYLVNVIGIEKCIEKYFYNLEEDYQNYLLPKIIEVNEDVIGNWLVRKLKNSKKLSKKMFYAKYLIISQKEEGLVYYLNWIDKNNMAYIDKTIENINEVISRIKNEKLVNYLIELLKITFRNNFKDKRFNGIYNNTRKALLNIASISNEKSIMICSELKKIIKGSDNEEYKNIGFMYYIIEEIEQKIYMNGENIHNIDTIIGKVRELDLKYKKPIVSWLDI